MNIKYVIILGIQHILSKNISFCQICLIKLRLAEREENLVNLVQQIMEIDPEAERNFADFYLTEDPSFSEKDPYENTVQMKITFKRTLSIEAINTFLPSLLLIILSYITVFFKLPKFFNTAITVNLSVMLTITTLLISVLNKLPTTSYIKWIEFWLIFAQLVPFTKALLITVIQWMMEKEEGCGRKVPAKPECWMTYENTVEV